MTSTAAPFGARLRRAVAERGNLCVGIDPHPALLEAWGLGVDAAGVAEFSRRSLEAFGDLVPAVKPQVAFFEEHGSAGFRVLEELLAAIGERGALSVADAKRGDIGSTMAGYARAWLRDGSPLACDALTVSPYLGVGALDAAFETAASTGRGLFVLARTSNPEAGPLQGSAGPTGTVAQSVVDEVARRNARVGDGAPGPFGVVVGATVTDPPRLDELSGPVLMPGVGEQGGTLADVRRIAGPALPLTLVNVSRHVLRTGPDVDAMRATVVELAAQYRFSDDS
ncbi:orotidine-5'-phosphate decarboxylase [Dietzia maris]|uniref:Orotidine-5'-phosphate decarboxylase n=1 Tax=Dietzia maris TaxID=37915 RepID=A0A365P8F5_9ACTN|nr:orotidine-5'-phosphate decarboxylase [Dietzia maris]MCT1433351.1 orotidine-5'-phosphate decarboxylase [Dietzia maris]MCT1522073.1 orotidine-5'-phosphate decarboxylase [Dietzia maris]RBA33539.1 orotidine-5'-phosphate decarboxylase [Dietzia maris]